MNITDFVAFGIKNIAGVIGFILDGKQQLTVSVVVGLSVFAHTPHLSAGFFVHQVTLTINKGQFFSGGIVNNLVFTDQPDGGAFAVFNLALLALVVPCRLTDWLC